MHEMCRTFSCTPNEVCFPESARAASNFFSSQGFLIDGFPFDVTQAKAFEADIVSPVAVLFFEASNDVLKERLSKRANFDDTTEAVEKRIESFNKETLPVVEAYKAKVKTVNAERSKEEIFADVQKIVESL